MNLYTMLAAFLGSGVEFVEALTIILAVGAVRGLKSGLLGALTAIIILGALIAIIGAPLVGIIHLPLVQAIVGILLLLFGVRWLRKAILRFAGIVATHDEAQAFEKEKKKLAAAGEKSQGIDRIGFGTAFAGTFLEGLEAAFIVITFGATAHAMSSAIIGAIGSVIVVILLGVLLRKPLTLIPENTMKYVVGMLLTSFGAFFVGESLGASWPQADLSILYIALTIVVYTLIFVSVAKSRLSAR
nr:hypothetical protein [Bacilli bacterium]